MANNNQNLNIPNVGGHANKIPAVLCYANSSLDTTNYYLSTASYNVSGNGSEVTTNPSNPPFGTPVTVTLTIGTHTFADGQLINVDGITPNGYNGSFIIAGHTSTTVSYSGLYSGPYDRTQSNGKVTYPPIKVFDSTTCY